LPEVRSELKNDLFKDSEELPVLNSSVAVKIMDIWPELQPK
jgi:DNA-directed RNA polymerase subunit F